MKSQLQMFCAIALTSAMVMPVLGDCDTTDAKDQKDLKKVIEDQSINYVETAQKGITLSGYVEASYTYQFASKGEYAFSSESQLRQFDTNNNNFNINAVKVALEKALPDKNDWAAGFRLDTIYGQDAAILSGHSSGDGNASGFYLEQAMVKFRVPVGNGLDIYAGKFVTFLGYEVIESPANLNFSRGLLFTNAIPLTHTGVYADYKFNDTVEAKLGVVDGWNTSFSPASTVPNNQGSIGKAITGQLNITAPGKNANICQSFIYSPEGEPGDGAVFNEFTPVVDNGPLFTYDIWGNWNPTFVKDNALTLGFNIDFGYNGASGRPDQTFGRDYEGDTNTWWGIALYSSYKLNKVVTLSARGEFLHDDSAINPKFQSSVDTNIFRTTPSDDFSLTLTASFNVWDNLLTRVEYRYDHFNSALPGDVPESYFGDDVGSTDQHEISLDAVYSF